MVLSKKFIGKPIFSKKNIGKPISSKIFIGDAILKTSFFFDCFLRFPKIFGFSTGFLKNQKFLVDQNFLVFQVPRYGVSFQTLTIGIYQYCHVFVTCIILETNMASPKVKKNKRQRRTKNLRKIKQKNQHENSNISNNRKFHGIYLSLL